MRQAELGCQRLARLRLCTPPGISLGRTRRDLPGVDAGPGDLAGEAAVLDLGAAVHDDLEAGGLGLGGGFVVAHAELHPQHLEAEAVLVRDGFARHRERGVGIAEDVDHVDGRRHVGKGGVHLLAEDRLAGEPRVDGMDRVALAEEILHGEVARPRGIGRGADEGEHARFAQDVGDVVVAVAVVVHARRYRRGTGMCDSRRIGALG